MSDHHPAPDDHADEASTAEQTDQLLPDWLRQRGRPVAVFIERHQPMPEMLGIFALIVLCFVFLAIQHRLGHLDADIFCFLLPAALLLRRRTLRGTFALISLIAFVQWLTSTPQNADVAVLIVFFWVTLDGELRELVVASAVMELGAVLAAVRWAARTPERYWVGVTGLAVAAGAVGLVLRERRALLVSMRERAARLVLERDQEGRLGAAAERARIAREMHDIVSHNLTVVVGLADGAGYALSEDPQAASDALDAIADTGRQALGDMRRLLGVLHEEPSRGSYEPQPGVGRLDDLFERVRTAGVPVRAAVSDDAEQLPSGVQLAVYRVAQEALTNTLKHAGRPAEAHFSLRCLSDRVELDVFDTGLPTFEAVSTLGLPRGGRGLTGMRERAAAYGGVLEAGPRADGGGWQVHLSLPLGVIAAASS